MEVSDPLPDLCQQSYHSSRQQEQIPSMVQTRREQEKRPRLLQWVLQMCADSRGKLHQGEKQKYPKTSRYLPVWELKLFQVCQQQAHPATCVLTPVPQVWVLWPAASWWCTLSPLPNVKSKKGRTLKCQPSIPLGRRESKAEVMYGRLWNVYMTYQTFAW